MNSSLPKSLTNSNPKMSSKKFYQLVGINKKPEGIGNFCSSVSCFTIITCSCISLFFVYVYSSMFFPDDIRSLTLDVASNEQTNSPVSRYTGKSVSLDGCSGKYIYVIDLPSQFNTDLLENCSILSPYTDECTLLKNSGLGIRMQFSDENVFYGSNWFGTDQYSLEVIFHKRMKQYKCLTNNYSEASAVFVPYYSGLDAGRYLQNFNATLRDETSIKFVEFIRQRPEWKRFGGRDHFLIAGRTTWDFRRISDNTSSGKGWGNRLLHLPEVKNMTSLSLEASSMCKSEIAIPYPTFFHPSNGNEVRMWQKEMRYIQRTHLFSFAGAPRPEDKESIRNILIEQCLAAKRKNCKHLHTTSSTPPETILALFQSSDFCLQPPGDTLTRKSFFDTITAGCIPVLFHPGSAYAQYVWHLPKDYSSYSVFIPIDELKLGKISIENRLLEIPKEKILAMREEVIKLIPRIIYANPSTQVDKFEDAFEVAVKGVLKRVERVKMEMQGGNNGISESSVPDNFAWKYKLYGNLENHEWDKYFDL